MEEKISVLQKLLDEGNKFNFSNSSTKGKYGYIETLVSEYTSWKLRTELTLNKYFGRNNAIVDHYMEHKRYPVMGNGEDRFNRHHQCIISSLKTAIDTLTIDASLLIKPEIEKGAIKNNKDVFIVHGHDEELKKEVEILVSELGLNPIVLHRKADEG